MPDLKMCAKADLIMQTEEELAKLLSQIKATLTGTQGLDP